MPKEKLNYDEDHPYEMRKPGCAGVASSIPNCGYSEKTLASLRKAGYKLYYKGKLVKPSSS